MGKMRAGIITLVFCLTSWFLFHFHGLACSLLIWLLLFLCCFVVVVFGFFLFIFFIYHFHHQLPKRLGSQVRCYMQKHHVFLVCHIFPIPALNFCHTSWVLPSRCLHAQSHTRRDTFFSCSFPPWCDYNSNAIVPLYVNVYYFSRYICSALLYSILFHPLHISIYIIELLIGLFSLPFTLMQAAFEIQRLISVVRWCEANGHVFFFLPCWAFFLMWTRHTCRAQIKQIAYFDSVRN